MILLDMIWQETVAILGGGGSCFSSPPLKLKKNVQLPLKETTATFPTPTFKP